MRAGRIFMLTFSISLFSSLAWADDPIFSMVADPDLILQDELTVVEIFLNEADDLLAWQVKVEVTGGDAGSLDMEDMFITKTRSDYVFYGRSSIEIIAENSLEMAASLMDAPPCDDVTSPVYLGTYEFRASSDATGVFNIRFVVGDPPTTVLLECSAAPKESSVDNTTLIGVEVDCTVDAHCDDSNPCTDDTCDDGTCVFTNDNTNTCTDGNDCTSDACVSGVCTSTNEPSGTGCDDGLFCTQTDECDGSGTCIGSGSPCGRGTPYCCEYLSICTVLPCV